VNEAKRWFSAAELAELDLAGLPKTKAGVQHRSSAEDWQRAEWLGTKWRPRRGQGGGVEYHLSVLPATAQARVLAKYPDPAEAALRAGHSDPFVRERLQGAWKTLTTSQRDEALRRARIMRALFTLISQGQPRTLAFQAIKHAHGVSVQTLYNWEKRLDGLHHLEWHLGLAPASRASAQPVSIEREAWDVLCGLYLRLERPSFDACLRKLKNIAAEKGWTLPSDRTLRRRIDALPTAVKVKAREGEDALKKLYPAQQRSREHMHPLHWVNADGHKFDVFVKWDDGTIGRPMMVAFQDIYSGMMLSWRVDQTENEEMVRLAYGDMVSLYGIPEHVLLDNGRAFASKKITGGVRNRYRFKVRPEDALGVITACGSEVHWATPYAGQSKPIERMFRDFATDFAKHPAFAGAYVGNNPLAKPENYGSKAVPIDVFMKLLLVAVAEHNNREGRRSKVCGGIKSFRQAFEDALATTPIRRAGEKQEKLWLLAAENIRPRKPDGAIHLMGNRYWHKKLRDWVGQTLVARFDPQALHEPLAIYLPNGRHLLDAEVVEAVGFDNVEAAKKHARDRRAWMRATAEAEALEKRLSIKDIAEMLPHMPEMPPPERKLIRPVFGAAAVRAEREDVQADAEIEVLAAIRRMTAGRLHVVQPEGDDD